MTMNLRECLKRYGLKESFVRKTSSVSKRGMIEDKGNGFFQIDDKEDFDQLLMDYVEKRSDVFVEGSFMSDIFGNNKWMTEIVANQKSKEIDTDKIYYNKSNQSICFYKFFVYEDELMVFKFKLSKTRKHKGYAFSSSFVCRTMKDYAVDLENVYYIPELKEWENEDDFYFYPEYSEYSHRLLKVVIKTLDLFADRFEERLVPKFPKNFHTIFWEDEYNINLDKFENLRPMSSAMKKIFKENNIF